MENQDGINRQDIKRLPLPHLAELVAPYLMGAFGATTREAGTVFSAAEWQDVFLSAAREEMDSLEDVIRLGAPVFVDEIAQVTPEAASALQDDNAHDVLAAACEELPAFEPFDYDTVNAYLRDLRGRFKTERGASGRQVMFCIRSALTGTLTGPCLVVVMILLGKARCLRRIQMAIP